MVSLFTKFQSDPMKTVHRRSHPEMECGCMDGWTDTGGYTIIPSNYRVVGYKNLELILVFRIGQSLDVNLI